MSKPLLRAMRHVLLERLATDGAQTLAELRLGPPLLLSLMLDDDELREALDSCRRHRLVEPLDPAVRELETAEWALTDLGRKAARSPFGGIVDRLAQSVSLLVLSTTILAGLLSAATGLDFDLAELDPTVALVLLVIAVMAGQLVLAVMNDRRHHVSRAQVARDWERLARERPKMHRLHTRKRWLVWPGIVGLVVPEVLVLVDAETTPVVVAIGVLGLLAFVVTQQVLRGMITQADDEAQAAMARLLEEAKEAGERLKAMAARRPEPQAPRRASSPA